MFLRAALILIGVAVILIAWVIAQPPPARPKLSIQLAGYTNDAVHGHVALLLLTNDNPTTIYAYMPLTIMQVETNRQMTDTFPARIPWAETLPPGKSVTLATPIPTNGVSWKLHLLVYNDLDFPHVLKRRLTLRRLMPFAIDTDWFPPPPRD